MGSENIWFDGVDKKLIETHSSKRTLSDGDDQTLMTKEPLNSLLSFSAKEKKQKCNDNHKEKTSSKAIKKPTMMNGRRLVSNDTIRPYAGITDELALDCEMVECSHHKSVLARVSIVNLFGHPILDRYVSPPSKVTDYRTRYSGIRKEDLVGAPEFETVQREVAEIIKGRVVVGHSVHNDFRVLKLRHQPDLIRDTSHYFKHLFQGKTPSLKKLCECILGLKIQESEHDSVQDAQATMKLYVKERDKWNKSLIKSKTKQSANRRPVKKTKTFYVMT